VTVSDGLSRGVTGAWNIVPTPFHPDGTLDEESIPRLVDFVVATGVDGLTILGVMGEAGKLGDAERSRVIARTMDAAAGRITVCVGVSHAATARAAAFAREAAERGASSVMLAPPPMTRPTDAALRTHFETVADAVSIPVVIQDHPTSSGVVMSVDLIAALHAAHAGLSVVKLEDEPSPRKIRALRASAPDLVILGGLGGGMLIEELRAGAHGTMTGFGFPEILVAVVARWFGGDPAGAAAVFDRYASLIRFENQPLLNLAIRKHVYQLRGAIAHSTVRPPGGPPDPGTISDLDDLLDRLGLRASLDAGALLRELLPAAAPSA